MMSSFLRVSKLSFFLLTTHVLLAQDNPQMSLDLDYSVFRSTGGSSFVELYYAFPKEALTFVAQQPSLPEKATVVLDLMIALRDSLVASKAWRMEATKDDSSESASNRVVDQLRFELRPGEYLAKLSVRDMNNEAAIDSGRVQFKVPVIADGFGLSDLQVATSINKAKQGGKKSVFFKNTLDVYPNPRLLYGEERPLLYYYYEAYDLDQAIDGDVYQTTCRILDDQKGQVDLIKARTKQKKVRPTSIEVGTVPVSALPTGRYYLQVAISAGDNELATREKPFYVYNSAVKFDLKGQEMADTFLRLSEKALDDEFELLTYITDKDDKEMWESLGGPEGKRGMLANFWRQRDPDPATEINEMRERYFQRVEYSNRNLKSLSRAGWKTDRGRVFILYGAPDNIDVFNSTEGTYPYVIWHYERIPREGAAQFIFMDPHGFREYRLIHSTVKGEVQSPDWEREIQIAN